MVLLGDEALDEHRARARGRLPIDIAHIVANDIGAQIV